MEKCKNTATFENTAGHSDNLLEGKAILAGWYLPHSNGKDLCPGHHKALSEKLGWKSLYEPPQQRGIPIKKEEADKSKAKGAEST